MDSVYTNGRYLEQHPTWHIEDAERKAGYIINILKRNNLTPSTVCDIGCGAGEVLCQLQLKMDHDCRFKGYEISPQAFAFCAQRISEKISFELKDICQDEGVFFDVVLVLDVIEHIENYRGFLESIKSKGRYKVFRIPLDISAQTVVRGKLMERWRCEGHIHHFVKETALQSLADSGYEVIDYFYTECVDSKAASLKQKAAKQLRKTIFRVNQDFAVRVMGGYSLMVLAT